MFSIGKSNKQIRRPKPGKPPKSIRRFALLSHPRFPGLRLLCRILTCPIHLYNIQGKETLKYIMNLEFVFIWKMTYPYIGGRQKIKRIHSCMNKLVCTNENYTGIGDMHHEIIPPVAIIRPGLHAVIDREREQKQCNIICNLNVVSSSTGLGGIHQRGRRPPITTNYYLS
jgi:hypothetical protein